MAKECYQDWEYYEVDDNNDAVDTVDIGFKTKEDAIADAQKYANEHNVVCYVCTSIAVVVDGYVIHRESVMPEVEPIKIIPQVTSV